jgi:hypothetical protein
MILANDYRGVAKGVSSCQLQVQAFRCIAASGLWKRTESCLLCQHPDLPSAGTQSSAAVPVALNH